MRRARIILAVLALAAGPVTALELSLPGNAQMTHEIVQDADSYLLPVGPYAEGTLPTEQVDGRVVAQAWKIDQSDLTNAQIIAPLQEQLEVAGYETLLQCGGQGCGGFDFRFNTRVMLPPYMYVDLFDFQFIAARAKGGAGADVVSVLASKVAGAGYVQIIQAAPDGRKGAPRVAPKRAVAGGEAAQEPSLVGLLTEQGHVILEDLDFGSGSASLGAGPYASLTAVAKFLLEDADRRIALVGHTDMIGSQEKNEILSRRRAQSVLARLVDGHGVSRAQLEADGVGALSPIASNATPQGREINRRVEAVLLTMEQP